MSSNRQSFHRVVAIDGPAASGKSSVARELAQRLGFAYVNSGAIYRAITWHILQKGIDAGDRDRVTQTAESAEITCCLQDNESRIFIDNVDPTDYLREDRVNESVSRVSSVPRVTTWLRKAGTSARSFFQTHPTSFISLLRVKCVCGVAPRKGSATKLPCVTTLILHGLSHRSCSRKMPMLSTRRILRSKESSARSLHD